MTDASQVPDYVADRGPARYFHGRKHIIGNFDKLIDNSLKIKQGTTFLIQGAPGAGKTALLEEMALDAMEKRWDVIEIDLDDLYNPIHMAQTLGKSYVARKQKATKVDSTVLSREHIKEVAGDSSVFQILEKINPRRGLILILDESQRVAYFSDVPDKKIHATTTLNKIHNGKLTHPIILLAAGLGQTEEAFRLLGISRFKGGCFVELGALDKKSEHAVIQDWLVKDGGAKGNPQEWVDAIAQKTHGWPQHIIAYGDAAAKQIQNDQGSMTPEGLDVVCKLGAARRDAYYKQRVKGISGIERSGLAKMIQNVASERGLYREEIEEFLSREYNDPDKAKGLFKKAVERGILHSQDELYSIPIPSMRTWLISNYFREQINHPPSHERSSEIGS